jgi:hypothetical protein
VVPRSARHRRGTSIHDKLDGADDRRSSTKVATSVSPRYVGPWLPEPVVESAEEEIDDITLPLMIALERLSPLERASCVYRKTSSVLIA